jgi:hypothetical protein
LVEFVARSIPRGIERAATSGNHSTTILREGAEISIRVEAIWRDGSLQCRRYEPEPPIGGIFEATPNARLLWRQGSLTRGPIGAFPTGPGTGANTSASRFAARPARPNGPTATSYATPAEGPCGHPAKPSGSRLTGDRGVPTATEKTPQMFVLRERLWVACRIVRSAGPRNTPWDDRSTVCYASLPANITL